MCVDVDEPWEAVWCNSEAPATGTEKCYECHRTIEAGELHTHGLWAPLQYDDDGEEILKEDEGDEAHFCRQCLAARVWLEKVCHSWEYGGIHEDLWNHFDELRPIRSLPLGRLVVGGRNQWKRRDGTLWDVETVRGWAEQGAAMVEEGIRARLR